jgi:hypothetical protein
MASACRNSSGIWVERPPMPEPGTFSRSWTLFLQSLRILRRHPRLLAFPAAGLGCALLMMVLFSVLLLMPRVLFPDDYSWLDQRHWMPLVPKWQALLTLDQSKLGPHLTNKDFDRYVTVANLFRMGVCYVFAMSLGMVTGLLNAAFYHEGVRALGGEDVSLLRGFGAACRRFRAFVNWFVFAAFAAFALQMIASRFGWAGKLAGMAVGLGWAAASFFVIPILLRNDPGVRDPGALLKESATLVKRTWGESVIGYTGLGLIGLPLGIAPIALYVACRWFGAATPLWIGAATVCALVIMASFAVQKAADGLYRCALYVYASEGVIPEDFTAEQMGAAWKIKGGT